MFGVFCIMYFGLGRSSAVTNLHLWTNQCHMTYFSINWNQGEKDGFKKYLAMGEKSCWEVTLVLHCSWCCSFLWADSHLMIQPDTECEIKSSESHISFHWQATVSHRNTQDPWKQHQEPKVRSPRAIYGQQRQDLFGTHLSAEKNWAFLQPVLAASNTGLWYGGFIANALGWSWVGSGGGGRKEIVEIVSCVFLANSRDSREDSYLWKKYKESLLLGILETPHSSSNQCHFGSFLVLLVSQLFFILKFLLSSLFQSFEAPPCPWSSPGFLGL